MSTIFRTGQGETIHNSGFIIHHYEDKPGFCKSATLEEITSHQYVLTPGRYVGVEELEDDGVPFEEKMGELTATLYQQMKEGAELDAVIRRNLEVLGYGG
nr:N-6 DNA methylase [Candidatus Electrothrix aestuarii]